VVGAALEAGAAAGTAETALAAAWSAAGPRLRRAAPPDAWAAALAALEEGAEVTGVLAEESALVARVLLLRELTLEVDARRAGGRAVL
jgi:hypothetical protein